MFYLNIRIYGVFISKSGFQIGFQKQPKGVFSIFEAEITPTLNELLDESTFALLMSMKEILPDLISFFLGFIIWTAGMMVNCTLAPGEE